MYNSNDGFLLKYSAWMPWMYLENLKQMLYLIYSNKGFIQMELQLMLKKRSMVQQSTNLSSYRYCISTSNVISCSCCSIQFRKFLLFISNFTSTLLFVEVIKFLNLAFQKSYTPQNFSALLENMVLLILSWLIYLYIGEISSAIHRNP